MTKVLLGSIQGPKGDTGDAGPAGATGVNALDTDGVYAPADGAINYIGPDDPGAVADGSVWFDTSS